MFVTPLSSDSGATDWKEKANTMLQPLTPSLLPPKQAPKPPSRPQELLKTSAHVSDSFHRTGNHAPQFGGTGGSKPKPLDTASPQEAVDAIWKRPLYNDQILKMLQDNPDIDLNVSDDKKRTLTLLSATRWGLSPLLRYLVEKGADVSKADCDGHFPLMEAVKRGPEMVSLILEGHHVDINQKDSQGRTALMESAKRGEVDTTSLLLNNGANRHETDNDGHTALSLALHGLREVLNSTTFLNWEKRRAADHYIRVIYRLLDPVPHIARASDLVRLNLNSTMGYADQYSQIIRILLPPAQGATNKHTKEKEQKIDH
jgi:hypothetical protein